MRERRRHWAVAVLAAALCSGSVAAPAAEPEAPALPVAARNALSQDLARLADWVNTNHGQLSAQFVDVKSGLVLARESPDRAQNPASNLKLFTAAAVLDALGPAHKFRTLVLGEMHQGVAKELVLKGEGDPDLRSEHLSALANQLVQRGLRRVSGNVVVDASAFDAQSLPPGFEAQPKEQAAFRAPVWALSVDRNAVKVFVAPASPGQPAQVWTAPEGLAVTQGSVQTGATGSGQKARLDLQQTAAGMVVKLGGSMAAGLPVQQFRRRIADPTLGAGLVFAHHLRRAGVQLSGSVTAGTGSAPVLALHESEPVRVLVHALGKDSDNFVAEMLLKSLGARAKGRPGTSAAGASAATDYARGLGIAAPQLEIRNGSGLFDGGRASAGALTSLLSRVYADPRVGPEFLAQLSIGGVDGTLRSRFRGQAKSRRVRAKTGTLARVIALSGYVLSKDGGGPVAFSILVQGVRKSHADIRARVDRVVGHAIVE